jgi:twitching motility protein PilT
METAALVLSTPRVVTDSIISRMLRTSRHVNDLLLAPGYPPVVRIDGQLVPVEVPGIDTFTTKDTGWIAEEMIASNEFASQQLKDHGSCDIPYSMPKLARLRVTVFVQGGTYAIVMRVVPTGRAKKGGGHRRSQRLSAKAIASIGR